MDILFFLRKLLNRFRKDDLQVILSEWGFVVFGEEGLSFDLLRGTKAVIISHIIDYCKNKKITLDDVAELDLIYNQRHPDTRKWTVYKLIKAADVHKRKGDVHIVPSALQAELKKEISVYFRHNLHIKMKDDCIWFRIHLKLDGSKDSLSDVIYVVHYPHSANIITSNIKVTYRKYLIQALVIALKCTDIQVLDLSGQHLCSLADMVLYQRSHGGFSQYRHNQVDNNPLSTGVKKRKESPPDISDDRILCENTKEKRARLTKTEEAFGKNKQPVIKKLTYRLDTRFHAERCVPGMSGDTDIFHCTVKFEGKDVLEGIKQLGPAGLAKLPLPSHLGNIHSLARNHMTIADKKS